jgi:hypothetical protein
MKKWYKICGFIGFFLTISAFVAAQQLHFKAITPKQGLYFFSPKAVTPVTRFVAPFRLQNNYFPQKIVLSVTPAGATQHYGFFCRAELKTDAVFKFPVRFRLGSLQYCDYLEGKSGKPN